MTRIHLSKDPCGSSVNLPASRNNHGARGGSEFVERKWFRDDRFCRYSTDWLCLVVRDRNWQTDGQRRSFARCGCDRDIAAVVLDNRMRGRQAKTAALLFGAEVRIENSSE